MAFTAKKIKAAQLGLPTIFTIGDKHKVEVSHMKSRHRNGLSVIEIAATCGEHVERHTWTIGAVDGPRPDPDTAEKLQEKLDNLREKIAHEAAWKEETHQNVQKLI